MDEQRPNFRKILFLVVLCALACGYYYYFYFNRAYVDLEITLDQPSIAKIYWADEGQSFSEDRRVSERLHAGRGHYSFYLTGLGRTTKLRIDPMQYAGQVTIESFAIRQAGMEPIKAELDRLQPANDIASVTPTEQGLRIVSRGNDPFLVYQPPFKEAQINWAQEICRYLLICLGLIISVRAGSRLRPAFGYVPLMLAAAAVLVVAMAGISERNVHPDEYVHLDAAAYYIDHWLPPRADDPAIEHTYSAYGVSRLNNGEVYYLLAGKTAGLVEATGISRLFSLRLFNLLLFGCILVYAIGSVRARIVAIPFLLTPQVWYIFSYCVSDAFGLFLCFIAACEIVRPRSCLNRLLDGAGRAKPLHLLYLTALFGLLLLLKMNYYPFIALVCLFVLWQLVRQWQRGLLKPALVGIMAVALGAVVLAGGRIGADYYVNGWDRQQKISAMQEKTADHWYKPSTELHKKHVSMYLKDRGTSLITLIKHYRWFDRTFATGVGVYGYFTIFAPEIYYTLAKWLAALLVGYIFLRLLWRGDRSDAIWALVCAGLALALIGASLHRSWTVDLQAQGRYLFPILPMLGYLLARAGNLFDTRLFIVGVVHLYLLSLYSFIFIALLNIPRIG